MYGSKLNPKFFGDGRAWGHFSAWIRDRDPRIMFCSMKKSKHPLYFWRKKIFNTEKPKKYRFFRFWPPVLRVNPASNNFLIVAIISGTLENTLNDEKKTKKIFEKKNLKKLIQAWKMNNENKMHYTILYRSFYYRKVFCTLSVRFRPDWLRNWENVSSHSS